MIPSPSPSVKIQNMGRKVSLRCKDKTLLGIVNKLLKTKSLLTTPRNVLPLCLKQSFPPIIWIFNEVGGDKIESRLPFQILSTFHVSLKVEKFWSSCNEFYFCLWYLQCRNFYWGWRWWDQIRPISEIFFTLLIYDSNSWSHLAV